MKNDESYFLRPFGVVVTSRVGKCNNCDFIFHLNPLDDESMKKYYEKNFQLRSLDLDLIEEHVHSNQAKFINNFLELKNKNVLEIGANTGRFLNHLKKLYNSNTYFDELNFEAKNILENIQGHQFYKKNPNKKFDVIVMRHVLEHIVEPIEYVKKLSKKIDDNGVIFIEVPDFSFIDEKTDTLLFEHVNYFSQKTLSETLDAGGYIVVLQEFSITKNYATCSDRVLRVLAIKKPNELRRGIKFAFKKHQYERVEKTNEKIKQIVKKLQKGEKIAFYGAGWWTERALLNAKIDSKRILGIFDKDEKKHGNVFHGVEVKKPSEILKLKPKIIFVLTSFEPQIKHDLKILGYRGKIIGWSDLIEQI